MLSTIAVATDGSETAQKAVDTAFDMARRYEAAVLVLTAFESRPSDGVVWASASATQAERVLATAEEAAEKADGVLVITEWKKYRELDPDTFGRVVRQKRVLDGRNALDRDRWEAAGWTYRALGRRVG